MRQRISNVYVDWDRKTMQCLACGDRIAVPAGEGRWVATIIRLFRRLHRTPTHAPRLTVFAWPFAIEEKAAGAPSESAGKEP